MDAISQTTFSSAFSWMKMFEFRLKFHWNMFLRVQSTIFQHWLSYYLNQWWLIYRRMYASLGLNDLIGLVDFQPSVAINAARIRTTRRVRHADHRNRSGTNFSRRAAELCACGQKFLTYGIRMPPWLRKTRAVPLVIIAPIATEYRARQCMTFRPHRLAIPRDRKSR